MAVNPHQTSRAFNREIYALAIITGAVVLLRDLTLLRIFSFSVQNDTPVYLRIDVSYLSLPYPLLNRFVNSINNPAAIILLQIVIAAAAVSTLIVVLGRINLALAILVSVLFASDITWSAANLTVLTESAFISFHVLCLACFLSQYRRRTALTARQLIFAGLLYGWTITFRPSGLLLIVPIAVGYMLFTRSWRVVGLMLGGFCLLLFVIASLNLLIRHQFAIVGRSGLYASFPLYSYHLFSIDNGPISRQIDSINKSCMPDLDYRQIDGKNLDPIWYGLIPCWSNRPDGASEYAALHLSAYVEAIQKQPVEFAKAIIKDNAFSISFPVQLFGMGMAEGIGDADCTRFDYDWCRASNARASVNPDLKNRVYLLLHAVSVITFPFKQTYLLIAFALTGVKAPGGAYYVWGPVNVAASVLWLVMAGMLITSSRGIVRVLVLACYIFIHYTMLTVSVAFIFVPRYTVPLAPFHSILSAVAIWLLMRYLTLRMARRRTRRLAY